MPNDVTINGDELSWLKHMIYENPLVAVQQLIISANGIGF